MVKKMQIISGIGNFGHNGQGDLFHYSIKNGLTKYY